MASKGVGGGGGSKLGQKKKGQCQNFFTPNWLNIFLYE